MALLMSASASALRAWRESTVRHLGTKQDQEWFAWRHILVFVWVLMWWKGWSAWNSHRCGLAPWKRWSNRDFHSWTWAFSEFDSCKRQGGDQWQWWPFGKLQCFPIGALQQGWHLQDSSRKLHRRRCRGPDRVGNHSTARLWQAADTGRLQAKHQSG